MLYGILTEWDTTFFEDTTVIYESVPDLAWKIWRLAPKEQLAAELVMPSGFLVYVEIDGNNLAFAIKQDVLLFEVGRNGAALLD